MPKAGEVLIRVAAAGVNRPDVLQRMGHYPVPPGASDLPGLEAAGTIAALGEGVTEWKVGDEVCALTPGGGYAEFCTTPASSCLPLPRGWSALEAASLPETFFTVWSNVFDRAGLKGKETFLVQGGSSGIGVAAIQMVRAMGHRVFATAGSAEKCAACVALGAERAINYKTEDFVEMVKAATGGRGVDVILDMVVGEYLQRDINALADDGRIVIIAFLGGMKSTIDMGQVLRRRLTISGSTLRPRRRRVQGQYRGLAAEKRLAADRIRQDQAGGPRHLPAGRGGAGACHDGSRAAYRQNHATRGLRRCNSSTTPGFTWSRCPRY